MVCFIPEPASERIHKRAAAANTAVIAEVWRYSGWKIRYTEIQHAAASATKSTSTPTGRARVPVGRRARQRSAIHTAAPTEKKIAKPAVTASVGHRLMGGTRHPNSGTDWDRAGRIGMLKWALIFFLVSLVAGFFGFTGVASGARTIAKVLFFIAIVIFIIVLVFGVMLGKLVF